MHVGDGSRGAPVDRRVARVAVMGRIHTTPSHLMGLKLYSTVHEETPPSQCVAAYQAPGTVPPCPVPVPFL